MARLVMPQRARGFTVIEALITLIVAGIGFLALVRIQTIATNNALITAQGNEAVHLAQDKLNGFRSNGQYAQIVGSRDGGEQVNGVNASFARSWTVTECAIGANGAAACSGTLDPTVGHYKQVMVRVSWNDVSGTPRFVLLASNFSGVESAASTGFFSR